MDLLFDAFEPAFMQRALIGSLVAVIAHRPGTIALADRVVLLADGRVAAAGTPISSARKAVKASVITATVASVALV